MMNLLDTQDKLKNFSEAQLVQEMQQPSGSTPQFLVLGEITRRQKMRQEAQRQAGLNQTTVAQDAVAAAGVPQGGLGDMARAMAPKSDIAGNTGVVSEPQKMQAGGLVERSSFLANDPATIAMANRMGMTVSDYIESLSPEARAQNIERVSQARANTGRVYGDVFDATRPVSEADQEVFDMGVNPSYATDMRDREAGIGVSDRRPTPSVTGGLGALLPQTDQPVMAGADDMYVPAGASIPASGTLPNVQGAVNREEMPMNAMELMMQQAAGGSGPSTRGGPAARKTEEAEEFAGSLDPFGGKGDPVFTEEQRRIMEQYGAPGSVRGAPVPVPYQEYYPTNDDIQFGGPSNVTEGDPLEIPAGGIEELMPPNRDGTPFVPQPSGTPTAPTGGVGGIASTSGGAESSYAQELRQILKDREASRDQDKWLALAEAGMAMMASKDPNFAVAAGEAGLRAAQSYREGRDQYDADRLAILKELEGSRLAEEQMAMRRAAAARSGSSGGLTTLQALTRGTDLVKKGSELLATARLDKDVELAETASSMIEQGRVLLGQGSAGTNVDVDVTG